jgi:hypothetical protein
MHGRRPHHHAPPCPRRDRCGARAGVQAWLVAARGRSDLAFADQTVRSGRGGLRDLRGALVHIVVRAVRGGVRHPGARRRGTRGAHRGQSSQPAQSRRDRRAGHVGTAGALRPRSDRRSAAPGRWPARPDLVGGGARHAREGARRDAKPCARAAARDLGPRARLHARAPREARSHVRYTQLHRWFAGPHHSARLRDGADGGRARSAGVWLEPRERDPQPGATRVRSSASRPGYSRIRVDRSTSRGSPQRCVARMRDGRG